MKCKDCELFGKCYFENEEDDNDCKAFLKK